MVVGRNNGVVGLTGFSDKKMSGLLFGPQKSGRINITGWSYGGVPLYFVPDCRFKVFWSYLCRYSLFKAFRKGLNHYLKRFEYSAASTGNVICVTCLRPNYNRNQGP